MSGSTEWPWPGDSREDRAKRVAISYRELIHGILSGKFLSPLDALCDLDDSWRKLQQLWVFPSNQPLRVHDWHTAPEMSELIGVPVGSIYMWAKRNHIRSKTIEGKLRFNVGDCIEYEAKRRNRRKP